MSHEIGQLDIPDPRLRTSSASSRAGLWTEIGEAQVTHTLFGRAKVRIIRKHDKLRRALWLTAAVAVLAVTAWQTWLATQQAAAPQSAESALPSGANAIEGAPLTQTEAVSVPAAEPMVQSDRPAPENVPQPAATAQTPVKPVPPAARNIAAKSPAGTQPPVAQPPAKAPVAPPSAKAPVAAAVATPRVAAPVTPPAASSQPEIPVLANPVAQESDPSQSSAGDRQAVETAVDRP